ncbi:Hypothetical protein PAU_03628 [Photorhabdus asymbiotica]|uniref:Uncharacterized protein n=1 Tax=Photorhabdus asymbiotica subsp. asymbiotica (strain ATCC 43949 / 3105-77) TaxID=553480 RepID=C7BL41_PHOAA|nr:Hypothetical protein PAU_03628 [Photorhabdus asymbiotica]
MNVQLITKIFCLVTPDFVTVSQAVIFLFQRIGKALQPAK